MFMYFVHVRYMNRAQIYIHVSVHVAGWMRPRRPAHALADRGIRAVEERAGARSVRPSGLVHGAAPLVVYAWAITLGLALRTVLSVVP